MQSPLWLQPVVPRLMRGQTTSAPPAPATSQCALRLAPTRVVSRCWSCGLAHSQTAQRTGASPARCRTRCTGALLLIYPYPCILDSITIVCGGPPARR